MKIISHRGYWDTEKEKNTLNSFTKSLNKGFGIETDLRDYNGELVISHDIPNSKSLTLDDFFNVYSELGLNLYLALNIKSDGLQDMLKQKIEKHKIENYFVFDMSIPDTIGYIKNHLNFFIRQSEIEKDLPFYEASQGVWIDCFYNDWLDEDMIIEHLTKNKKVCIVSPELHKRPFLNFWTKLKSMEIIETGDIFICTDHPEKLKKFMQ